MDPGKQGKQELPSGRTEKGQFAPGHSGNPAGRAPGVPALARMLRKTWEENAKDYSEVLDRMLREQDATAWKLMMERADPVPKEVAVTTDGKLTIGWADSKPEDESGNE